MFSLPGHWPGISSWRFVFADASWKEPRHLTATVLWLDKDSRCLPPHANAEHIEMTLRLV